MIGQRRESPPRFRGVSIYQDPLGRFAFRYPSTWNTFELPDGQEGALFSPEASAPQTYLAAWANRLPESVVAEDLDLLSSGMAEGLARLNSCEVLESHDDAVGNLVRLERLYTFSDDDAVRQRRVWVVYVDTWQIVLVYQGESRQEYEYWSPMGNYSFATFNLAQDLWFSTERACS
ncbi:MULTISPECIES: hypothetical protein [Kribbella]|uniref:DUF1795 domain-containing protein n=1 Tax=Kribbella pratensis TaxID=2512112 RepID=A0ABY2F818_9ACTN|nr:MULTISPECIES: hypothetical protein [Kribbella]TDW79436.1 hypothetical protein EV647_8241 [Kribbella sp. VKM Ac-2566]TDW84414.1 hypothetical protein EV137_7226 [Kribbella pratensis]